MVVRVRVPLAALANGKKWRKGRITLAALANGKKWRKGRITLAALASGKVEKWIQSHLSPLFLVRHNA